MQILRIEKKVENTGEGMDFLRSVIGAMNRGIVSGKGWIFGEGEIEKESDPIKSPVLNELALKLSGFLSTEDKNPDDIHEFTETILSQLSDALYAEGYGVEAKETGAGAGDKPEDGESAGNGDIVDPGASQELSEGGEKVEKKPEGGRFPWNRGK